MTNEERNVLVEQLRDAADEYDSEDPESWPTIGTYNQAVDQIEADGKRIAELEAEIERLREALGWYVAEDEKYIRAALGERA